MVGELLDAPTWQVQHSNFTQFGLNSSPELAAFLQHHPIRQQDLLGCVQNPQAVAEARGMVAGLQDLLEEAGRMLPGYSAEAVLLVVAHCTIRRGRGGPAAKPDAMQDSSSSGYSAARILANRESAAISKLRCKIKQAAERLCPAVGQQHTAAGLRMHSTDPSTTAQPAAAARLARPAAAAKPAAGAGRSVAPASSTQLQLRVNSGLAVNRLPLKKASSVLVQMSRAVQITRCSSDSSCLPGVDRVATGPDFHARMFRSSTLQLKETADFVLMPTDAHLRHLQALAEQQQQRLCAGSSLGKAAGSADAAGVAVAGLSAAPAAAAVYASRNSSAPLSHAISMRGTDLCPGGNSALWHAGQGVFQGIVPGIAATGGAGEAQGMPAAADGPSHYPAAANPCERWNPQQPQQQQQEQAPLASAWAVAAAAALPVAPAAASLMTDAQQADIQTPHAAQGVRGDRGTDSGDMCWLDDDILAALLGPCDGLFS